ncbi:quinoprotein dehydrogenase-associated SoxYZ-like carrier [Sedimentitalea sp. JM2-8]|uniref:Quinoprotein dehydrogenase-associated SoxYZ-like carrier n=1 Tax=Sedimentitalea xiamensis TaxID=3050037 RepID=A0ABT7FFS2_9RHOB|nr:quinoprotein dehydrogenase-associated SoxYZ-like carrier [Sedimentitalea xiamensis]MDK3073890.1 quinoprotein dehydrogenase-associated SoxYZ-like carrier [Sedimentitalea xiamensis]
MLKRPLIVLATATAGLATSAQANDPSWPDLRAALYADQSLTLAGNAIRIDTPYRTQDDTRTRIAASLRAPEGQTIQSVTVILDENPMPVSAVFDLHQPLPQFDFEATMRVNGPTPVHVVARTSDNRLLMSESFVKTSGTGACAAPPGTDPEKALASLGRMQLDVTAPDLTARLTQAGTEAAGTLGIAISHPSHSGMQMDQISLLFIPARYVHTLDVDIDDTPFARITGSISLSENPQVAISIPAAARAVAVTMTDTDGTVSRGQASVAGF